MALRGNHETYPTIRAAAARLGVGERVIRGAIARGELALYCREGAWPRVCWSEVETWFRAGGVKRATVATRPGLQERAEARAQAVLEREETRATG